MSRKLSHGKGDRGEISIETLAGIERALREAAERRMWGQLVVHFKDGRPYEIRIVETRILEPAA